jgi:hypothetical protein
MNKESVHTVIFYVVNLTEHILLSYSSTGVTGNGGGGGAERKNAACNNICFLYPFLGMITPMPGDSYPS